MTAEPLQPGEPVFDLESAIRRGVVPRDVLRVLRGEQRRRAQAPSARDAARSAAEAKRDRRRARNLRA